MRSNQERLLENIHRKREVMVESAKTNGISSELTIRYSQELDVLIYEYQMLTTHSKRLQTGNIKMYFKEFIGALKKAAV
ncbi:stage 0 sporulation regulatory protein [Cytobacillus horneckiae]|uniref:Aspartyl-phosphate phosphatase Spo0E family protein n=1 Tax=Cytobacillus horneckiae TaxID=549687 RepID=A0A2N0Z8X3_9BACI|nr:aspartyl-phosphate phosphatase Spo0E family protein [Cytobacillus horneckiae]MBN6889253.1 aspartyl-phosphate phosphatase Spo0E family protein [Cytobacillus horneckiae]MCM3178473.1 aspartyl-phosphate phosphatase Spo0E family protein [Cytobacillus horneckiae]MEC1156789.1 aspartyl-phosphate phosphatase Spo0E family protein [Cytobacillus horneckiae]MED2940549.1 aspartyl-phosphate phosphatase Spo0E family protein [Cytobacillus horneckiae]PKG25947.1 aspartyl-phosphate phosphatase Spo0E family pro